MANILFKKGTYSEFKNNILTNTSNIVDGALYLTTDEGGLYLGVQNNEGVKSVTRIQGSLLYFNSLKEFQDSVAPPYSTDVVYLIAEDNALVRWTGTKWTVLNATASEVTTAIDELRVLIENNSTQILGEKSRAEAKEGELLTLINQQGETLEAHNQALANKVDKSTYDTLVSAVSTNSQSIEGLSTRTGNIETEINATIKPDIVKNKEAAKAAHDAATEANTNANNRLSITEFNTFKTGDFKAVSDQVDANVEQLGSINEDINTTIKPDIIKANDAAKAAHDAATAANNNANNRLLVTEFTTFKNGDFKTVSDKANANGEQIESINKDIADTIKPDIAKNKKAAEDAQKAADDANNNAEKRLLTTEFNTFKNGAFKTLSDQVSANGEQIESINEEINVTIKPDIAKNKEAAKDAHDAADAANENAEKRLLTTTFNTFKDKDFKSLSDKYSDLEARVGNEESLSAGFTESLKKCLTIDGKTAMTGNLNMGSKKIQNVADGTDPTDAVNLQQLQAVSSGINGEFTEVKQDIADNAELINKINSLLKDKVKIDDTSGKITLINDLDANEHIIQNIVYPLDASNKEIINDTDVANVAYVKAQMKAAEAMTFRGVVSNTKALPTSGVQTGDTYKVSVAYDYVIGVDAQGKNITKTANVGDLFINSAADDATPQWEHVSSGYEESSQQKIFSDDDYLYLSDGINNTATAALSKISFVGADHSNFNFTIAQSLSGNQTNNTVTASLVWGSF